MHRPVQQTNTHPGGETRPQVKEIRCHKMVALPQRGRASLLNQALHQAGHLQDRDPGRASMPHRTRKAFSVRPSGFFTDPTPLPDPIGTWMTIFRQEAQGGDFSFNNDHISAHILFSEIHIVATDPNNSCEPSHVVPGSCKTCAVVHSKPLTSYHHARKTCYSCSRVLLTYLPDAILAGNTMVRRPP
jgi:hypothetical protein